MTAIPFPQPRRNNANPLFLAALVTLSIIVVGVMLAPKVLEPSKHAVSKHGLSEAERVAECISNTPESDLLRFHDPQSGNRLTCAYDPDSGLYAMSVDEYDNSNITRFLMRKVRTLEQLLKRMNGRDAIEIIWNGTKFVPK